MKKVLLLTLLFVVMLTGCFDTSTGVDSGSNSDNLEVVNFISETNTDELGNVIPGESNGSGSSTTIHSSTPIPIDKLITISFSESINAQTVNASTAYINNPNGVPVPAQLTVVNNQISIIPNEFLLADVRYTIVITTGVKDIRGRSLEGLFLYTFPTEPDITIDLIAPTLLNLSPANGEVSPVTTDIVMSFTESIIGNVAILLINSDTNTVVEGRSIIIGNILRFVPQNMLINDANYMVSLQGTLEDLDGNVYTGLRGWSFSIVPVAITPPPVNPPVTPPVDTIAPTLISVTPIDSSIVGTTTTIMMSFDENIAGTAVLNLRDVTSSSDVAGVSSINGNSLEFTPNNDLTEGHNYTASLENTVEDLTGNEYTGQTSWSFSVTAAPPPIDTTVPTLVSFTPSNGALVDGTTAIVMTFNEDIKNTGDTLIVTNNVTSTIVDGASGVSANTLWFIPQNPLPADNYTVTVDGLTSDLAGNPYMGVTSWSFDVNAPANLSIVSINSINKQIDVHFSEALDTSTVSIGDFIINSGAITINSINFTTGNTIVKIHADEVITSGTVINISGDIADIFGALHNSGVDADYILL